MSLNAKSKRKKVTLAVHSILEVLVGHIVGAEPKAAATP